MDKDEIEDKIAKVHSAVLTEDEKAKIKAQVEKELDAEAKKQISDDYKATLKAAAKKKALFKDAAPGADEEGLVRVKIDPSLKSECIRLDGTCYYPGRTYSVTPGVADVLSEVMGRGEDHDNEITGRKNPNQYRKQRRDGVK